MKILSLVSVWFQSGLSGPSDVINNIRLENLNQNGRFCGIGRQNQTGRFCGLGRLNQTGRFCGLGRQNQTGRFCRLGFMTSEGPLKPD